MFIFDEPTTGLHFHDINKLLDAFNALIARGHTIVIVEHNMDVIKCADWVVDLGPEAGDRGGSIVFEGTPDGLAGCKESYTGRYLRSARKTNKTTMEFTTYTLPNGIRGIHRRIKGNVTHCALLVNAGSRDELKNQFGLAHFTEHALFKGTEHRKAYQVNCRLENLGGELNAFTTKGGYDDPRHDPAKRLFEGCGADRRRRLSIRLFPDRELEKKRRRSSTTKSIPTRTLRPT